MVRRSTLVVVLIFLVVGGLAYFLQRSGKLDANTTTTPTTSSELLFNFQSQIVGLQLEKVGQGLVDLNKDAQGKWNLVTPAAPATDSGQVESAISELAALRIVSKLDPPPSPADAGLATPVYKLQVKLEDGTQDTMDVGKETPTGGNYYVQVSNRGVFIVSKYSLDPFLKLVDEPPILETETPTAAPTTGEQTPGPASGGTATPAP